LLALDHQLVYSFRIGTVVTAFEFPRCGKSFLEGFTMAPPSKTKVIALQRNAASLLKLLGGTADERLRFWEIFKGITTPVEVALIDQQIGAVSAQVSQATAAVKQLQKTAAKIQR
jgi:hypothetical protein